MKYKINDITIPQHKRKEINDKILYLIENNLFTGDTLFCRGVGTTAYGGNEIELKNSLNFLCLTNGDITLWPGHNYGGSSCTLK